MLANSISYRFLACLRAYPEAWTSKMMDLKSIELHKKNETHRVDHLYSDVLRSTDRVSTVIHAGMLELLV